MRVITSNIFFSMNTNTVLVAGIVAVLAIGGLVLYMSQSPAPSENATSTTGTTNGGTGTVTPPVQSQAGAPRVVTDPSVAPSNSTAVVTGKVSPNGAPTVYWYEYGESTTLGSRTASQAIGSGFNEIASPGYITGLRANTRYNFRLTAQNSFGTVNGAMYSFNTNNNPPTQGTPPSAATNAAEDVTRTSATLNGRVNPRASQTTYWFEYGTTADFGRITTLQSGGSGDASIAVSASVSQLDPQTKYYFRINAQNQYGTVNGGTQSFTTKGPAAATSPTVDTTAATRVATSTATLNGRISPNGAETTYSFEFSEDSLLGSILGSVSATQTVSADASTVAVSADVAGLARNTRYFFRLVAGNQYGTARGDIVSFRTAR